jgi:hypothetical protein
MSNRSYLSRIAGTGPALLMLKPPRLLFAPTTPEAESVAPQRLPADPRSGPAVAPVPSPEPPEMPPAADATTLPQLAAPSKLAEAAPAMHIARAMPLPASDVPVDQQPPVADKPLVREVAKTSEKVLRVEVPVLVPSRPGGADDMDDAPVSSVAEPEPRLVGTPNVISAAAEPAPVKPVMIPSDADDAPVRNVAEPELRFVGTANVARAALQAAPVKHVMILRPRNAEGAPDAAPVEPPTVEKDGTRTIRLEPPVPQPPAQAMDLSGQETRVRIGCLEVRIVHEAPATAAGSQPQAAPAAPVRTRAQARPSTPLSRAFRAFGLAQG